MKLIHIAAICTSLAMLTSSSCKDTAPDVPVESEFTNVTLPDEPVPIELNGLQMQMLDAGNDFAFGLFRQVAAQSTRGVFISPLSVQVAMSMVAAGTRGDTFNEIAGTLGYAGYSAQQLDSLYETLMPGLLGADPQTTLDVANSLWADRDCLFKPAYLSTLAAHYQAEANTLDFSSSAAAATINRWCSGKTHGMVPDILDEMPPDAVAYIVNALYFKGMWMNKFDARRTAPAPFFISEDEKVQVDMMHQTCRLAYSETSDAQFCSLPFGDGAFCLDIVLPGRQLDFGRFVSEFTPEKWESRLPMHPVEVVLSLPKFSMDCKTNLTEHLQIMGIRKAFSGQGDFSAMSDMPLALSRVLQRAVFKMDEDGAEAAAVTIAEMKFTSIGPDRTCIFTADHPFLFFIRETSTGALLFMGTYTGE